MQSLIFTHQLHSTVPIVHSIVLDRSFNMPAKKATITTTTTTKKPVSGLSRIYLFLYNLISLGLWASCTLRTALLIPNHLNNNNNLPAIFAQVFPLLALTQSLAALEIVHSLVGLVRAPVTTTAMQVASRFLVVWGVMFAFCEGSEYVPAGAGILGSTRSTSAGGGEVQYGDYAFFGCMFAWGVTEVIRYGFFAMQLAGVGVPGFWLWLRYFSSSFSLGGLHWLNWLRYNTFFVLYPIGISSECALMYLGLGPAAQFVSVYYQWFLIAMLAIYVPGMFLISFFHDVFVLISCRKLHSLHAHDGAAPQGDARKSSC